MTSTDAQTDSVNRAIRAVESSTPEARWGNRIHRTHRGSGGGRVPQLWSRDACLHFLAEHIANSTGPLPIHDYNELTKGRNLPPSQVLRRHFKFIRAAWIEAGAPDERLAHGDAPDWTQEEDDYLREHAGDLTRKQIARRLGRTDGAVKTRANKVLGIHFRKNAGYMSATALANRLGIDPTRVLAAINSGALKARKIRGVANRWDIDPLDVKPGIFDQLTAPPVKGPNRVYTHAQVETMIAMREEGATWKQIGAAIGHPWVGLNYRYEAALTRRPRWRAIWYVCQEFGGSCDAIDVVEILKRRGHPRNLTYSAVIAAAQQQPGKLRVDAGVITVVIHTSKRVRPTAANPYTPAKDLE